MNQPSVGERASKSLDSKRDKSYKLITELIDHFIMNEQASIDRMKLYITDLICTEVRQSIHENISTIISERSTIQKLEQQIKDKDYHIEQLELMIFELQSLVRLKSIEQSKGTSDDDVQLDNSSAVNASHNIFMETAVDKIKKKNFSSKLRSFFSIASHCRNELT